MKRTEEKILLVGLLVMILLGWENYQIMSSILKADFWAAQLFLAFASSVETFVVVIRLLSDRQTRRENEFANATIASICIFGFSVFLAVMASPASAAFFVLRFTVFILMFVYGEESARRMGWHWPEFMTRKRTLR